MKRWKYAVAAVAMAGLTIMAAAGGDRQTNAEAATTPPRLGVNFLSPCGYSHSAADDPIVAPGKPGASHMHDFFGNRSTNAASTYESLQAAAILCRRPLDTAAYWTPSLYQDGTQVKPIGVNAYYLPQARTPRRSRRIRPA